MAHHGRRRLSDFPCRATAVDLGSATVRMHLHGRGIVARQPSAMARCARTGRLLATGTLALTLASNERGVTLVHPIRNGVPAETDETESLLRFLLRSHHRMRHMAKPNMVVAVPSTVNQVHLAAVREAAYGAGARRLMIVPAPVAAAHGVGIPGSGEDVAIIADIGAQVTDVGVLLGGELVGSHSALVGGAAMDEAIIARARWKYGLVIGPVTAEAAKLELGTATPDQGPDRVAVVHGKDRHSDLPCRAVLSSTDVHAAIAPALGAIVRTVRTAVSAAPPEMARDFLSVGITLTGGAARLPGLDELIRRETGLRARVAPDAADAVVLGAAELLRPDGRKGAGRGPGGFVASDEPRIAVHGYANAEEAAAAEQEAALTGGR
ncbi:rod shape-determining protein [Actinomadura vinacea]|uniref:Rod shape-determining protein n=1 Tax=Actinomadura vinacea TaxID=115336 RepID=A0ABN3JNZ8_9ACTN